MEEAETEAAAEADEVDKLLRTQVNPDTTTGRKFAGMAQGLKGLMGKSAEALEQKMAEAVTKKFQEMHKETDAKLVGLQAELTASKNAQQTHADELRRIDEAVKTQATAANKTAEDMQKAIADNQSAVMSQMTAMMEMMKQMQTKRQASEHETPTPAAKARASAYA